MRLYSGALLTILCAFSACGESSKDGTPGDADAGNAGVSRAGAGGSTGPTNGGRMPGRGGAGVAGLAGAGGLDSAGGADEGGASGIAGEGGVPGDSGRAGAGGVADVGGRAGGGGTSGVAGRAGAGGGAHGGGRAGAGGGSGTGQSFVDPAGDASRPELDLVSGSIHRDGEFFEFRLLFVGAPLDDGGELQIAAGAWSLSVERHGAGLSLRLLAGGLSAGLDACTHIFFDADAERLIVRVPVVLFPSTPTSANINVSTIAGGTASSGDRVASFRWAPLVYPGAVANAAPACDPWSTARKSTLAFRDVSLGNGFGCGVTLTGEAICWGEAEALSTLGAAPAGPFEQVAVSTYSWWREEAYVCALRSNGQVTCWGGSPPTIPGDYRSLGDPFGCAIRESGDLVCWESETGQAEVRSVPGPITEVIGVGTEECHRMPAGTISCSMAAYAPTGNDFIGLAFGSVTKGCGLRQNGRLDCELASALPYRMASIDAGSRPYASFAVGCGLTDTGSPVCWGGAGVVAPVPPGPFERLEVSSTSEGMCGFRADSTLVCWDYSHVAGYPVPATSPP